MSDRPSTAYRRFTHWGAWADSAALPEKFARKLVSAGVKQAISACTLRTLEDLVRAASVTTTFAVPPQQLAPYLAIANRWLGKFTASGGVTPGLQITIQGEKNGFHLQAGLKGPLLITIARLAARVTIV